LGIERRDHHPLIEGVRSCRGAWHERAARYGMKIPTPMGWLSPEMLARYANNMVPSREAIADTLGVPMEDMAWVGRTRPTQASIEGTPARAR